MLCSNAIKQQWNTDIIAELNSEVGSSATINFFDGTIPAACEDADAGTLLATLALDASAPWTADPSFTNPSGPVTAATAVATGVASYWRIKDGLGVVVMQGSCAIGGGDISFDNNVWASGDLISITQIDLNVLILP